MFGKARGFARGLGGAVGLAWQGDRWALIGLIALTFLNGALPLASALIFKLLFDVLSRAASGRVATQSQMTLLIAGQAVLLLASHVLGPVERFLENQMALRTAARVQELLLSKVNSLQGIGHFETSSFQDALQTAALHTQHGAQTSLRSIVQLVRSVVTLIGFLVTLAAFSLNLIGIVLLAALPRVIQEWKTASDRAHLSLSNSPRLRHLFAHTQMLTHTATAKEVRVFDLGRFFLDKILALYRTLGAAERQQRLRELRMTSLSGVVASATAGGAFAVIGFRAASGELSLGEVSLYLSAVSGVEGALSAIAFGLAQLNEFTVIFGEFRRVLEISEPLVLAVRPRLLPRLGRGIEFRNISFRYTHKHPWVLRNLDLYVPAGKCVALVGVNGAGKTTLVKLLTRLYDPVEGEILWDGIDLRDVHPRDLRSHVGVVFQDFAQYPLSVLENIGAGDVAHIHDRVRVQTAAAAVGIHSAIERLPRGYDTVLHRALAEGNEGADLSLGQWQRLAVARLLMRDAEVLILDEPTSFLDPEAESEFYNRFVRRVHEQTTILITHRVSTIRMADLIALLSGGQVVEYGTHGELLAQGGMYSQLYHRQVDRILR